MAQHRQVGFCGAGGRGRLLWRRLAVGRRRAVVHLQEYKLMTSTRSFVEAIVITTFNNIGLKYRITMQHGNKNIGLESSYLYATWQWTRGFWQQACAAAVCVKRKKHARHLMLVVGRGAQGVDRLLVHRHGGRQAHLRTARHLRVSPAACTDSNTKVLKHRCCRA